MKATKRQGRGPFFFSKRCLYFNIKLIWINKHFLKWQTNDDTFYFVDFFKRKKISAQIEWKENETTYFVSWGQAMIIIYLFIRLLVETIYFSYIQDYGLMESKLLQDGCVKPTDLGGKVDFKP